MGTSTASNWAVAPSRQCNRSVESRNWRNSDKTIHRLWYAKGKVLAKQGYFEAALASFDAALRLRPNHSKSWVFRGVVLAHLQQFKAALASFEQALTLDSESCETWIFRGAVLTTLGDRPEAFSSYSKALALQHKQGQVCNEYPLWASLKTPELHLRFNGLAVQQPTSRVS